MVIQSVVVVGVISLCGAIAVRMTRHGLSGRWGWIAANAVVVLGAILALALALDWAGWLTAALFALLVVAPLVLLHGAGSRHNAGNGKRPRACTNAPFSCTQVHGCASA
jgi:hypothetical protein